jgi:hypothetical protein
MQFSPFSCHFISLRSKYPPQHPVFKHPSLCSSVIIRDRVSHPYITTGKSMVLYFLIFKFLYRNRSHIKYKTVYTRKWQHSWWLRIRFGFLQSCYRFCGLVTRVPIYRSGGPCSIPGATRFSEKWWVWNGVHSASWVHSRN